MQLPKIVIEFKSKAQSVITRSERGIVAVILKDDTEGAEPFKTYKSLSDVDFTKMSEDSIYSIQHIAANHGYFINDNHVKWGYYFAFVPTEAEHGLDIGAR